MLIIWVDSMLLRKLCPIEHVYDDGISVDNNMYKTYEKWIDKNKIQRSTLRSGDVVDFWSRCYICSICTMGGTFNR